MKNANDLYMEKDKNNCPFLLAASFNNFVEFKGSYVKGDVLYWYFSPKENASTLIKQFQTKTEPHIPAQDIFVAVKTFWSQVNDSRKANTNEK